MKKTYFNLYFVLTIIIFSLDQTYALELSDPTIIGYLICGLFIIIGLLIIIFGNKQKTDKPYFKKDDNKLKQTNKQKDTEDEFENIDIPLNFNPDSIFKIIPTFSNKKFFEGTYKKLEKNILNKNKNTTNIILIKKGIIDFKNEPNKYIIKSEFIVNFLDEKKQKKNHKYIITSENSKENNLFDRCPTCGGKIKDTFLLRCTYCHSILSSNKSINNINNNWKLINIEEIKKKEKTNNK